MTRRNLMSVAYGCRCPPARRGGTGTVIVGSGATLSATSHVGVAFDADGQTTGTGTGTGTLIADGTVNITTLNNGSNGCLGGSGTINANVVHGGLMNAGNSPGRLTIDGGLDSRNGSIVLEVQSLAGWIRRGQRRAWYAAAAAAPDQKLAPSGPARRRCCLIVRPHESQPSRRWPLGTIGLIGPDRLP